MLKRPGTLDSRLRLLELEAEMRELREFVETVYKIVDPAEIAAEMSAAHKLKKISPTTSQLRIWAQESLPPENLPESPDYK